MVDNISDGVVRLPDPYHGWTAYVERASSSEEFKVEGILFNGWDFLETEMLNDKTINVLLCYAIESCGR